MDHRGSDDAYLLQKMKVNILLLNYNGKDLLAKNLPSFLEAQKESRHFCRLGVVDNRSSDGSVEFLKKGFPGVEVYPAAENRVLCSYNEVAGNVEDDILIFMNNDIKVDAGFVDPLVEPFLNDPSVFFVTPRCLGNDGQYEGNKTRAFVRFGLFGSTAIYPGYEKEVDQAGPTFQGGFGAFDRKKFLELGGYDDLFLPGRLEDADICFRAHKRGWVCLYEPKSAVYHEGGVSFHKVFGPNRTLTINSRNTFLFMWKNLSDRLLILSVIFWLPARLFWSLISGKKEVFLGFLEALPLRGEARKRRDALKRSGFFKSVPDRKIFAEV